MSKNVCFCGESVGKESAYLLGRIRLWRRGGISRLPVGCVLLLSSERDICEVRVWLGCGMRVAGAIIPHAARRSPLAPLSVPCFFAEEKLFERELDGRIVLIDFCASKLFLDPDLDTLDAYARREEKSGLSASVKRGILRSAKELAAGGELFENALALMEKNYPTSLCVSLDTSQLTCESFAKDAEALFCAAVYGELSIMLAGFSSPSETERATSLLYSSFCELEAEGREVNGCVSRGILIDAPIWLCERHRLGKCDFICFDFDLLAARLLGVETGAELKRAQVDSLCRFWEDYRSAYFGSERAELRAVSRDLRLRELFFDWAEFMNIVEIYDSE